MEIENREEIEEARGDDDRSEEKRTGNNSLNLIITSTAFLRAERTQSTWNSVSSDSRIDVVDRSVMGSGSREGDTIKDQFPRDKDIHEDNWPVVTKYRKLREDDEEVVEIGIRPQCKEKKHSSSLRSAWEKRGEHIERVEKMLESHVERVLEDKLDKHPWLQPIETWINEKCKTPTSPAADNFGESQSGYFSDGEKTQRGKSRSPRPGDEGRKHPDQKMERSIIEHLKSLRAKHEKIQQQRAHDSSGRSGDHAGGFKLTESTSDNRIFERKVLEQIRNVRSGGSSPIAPKRNRAEKDPNKIAYVPPDDDPNKNPSFSHSNSRESHDPSDSPQPSAGYEPIAITPPPDIQGVNDQEEPLGNRHHHDFIDKIKEGFKGKREELHRVRDSIDLYNVFLLQSNLIFLYSLIDCTINDFFANVDMMM